MEESNSYLEDLFGLDGKTVLVTGAVGQLGKVLCQGFLDAGSKIIGVDLIIDDTKIIQDDKISYYPLDITIKQSVKNLFAKLYKKYNSIDVLINNAGVSTFELFEDRQEESFDWVSNVNLKGTFICIREYFNTRKIINLEIS